MARPSATTQRYLSNTALYADPALTENLDYARWFRHAGGTPVVLAPHGGQIEPGTSQLCRAIARASTCDYWLFEGLRGERRLHVTSSRCDDPVALALCAGTDRALSLHGCITLPREGVLIGGLDAEFGGIVHEELTARGIETLDAAEYPTLAGRSPRNIVNRTRTGMGVQLELPLALRDAMRGDSPLAQSFVDGVVAALRRVWRDGRCTG
ncbi:poly-gamma-glutamate hydrolase family protein [Amycolatopsis sp. 195334CR]|uniref:poly-gamma-glutamate hydrolase family protein n=1 Tax=Amycolatopsis sp. 195334CR TaxID=2814588 RepID=UPI001A8E615C|nr:poly-gamma-glutamate hydrolase family protein [Amycolatopsis sp. 195334CR]MBN6033808.1 poly-gamma-glutamate hydrolase family protein [Amycolatopsis sp. 195334CR]